MPGEGDARGDGGCGAQAATSLVTVAAGSTTAWSLSAELLGADSLGVAAAEGVVGQRAGSALGVVDDGGLEQRALGRDALGERPANATSLITSRVTRPPTLRTTIASLRLEVEECAGSA